MNLTNKEIYEYKIKLSRLVSHPVLVYSNGRIEIGGLQENEKSRIYRILLNCPEIKSVSENPKRYNFSSFDYSKVYARPKVLYSLTAQLKENEIKEIKEDIEIHKELNPKIWTSDNKLIPSVERKIEEIVDSFIENLKEYEVSIKMDDIYILGSNANYNYTKHSDLDIHIIADEDVFNCSENHLPLIYNCMKSLFNEKYDITINGIPVEIYVENKNELTNVSTGVYSLNSGWLKEPSKYTTPEINKEELNRKVINWVNKYNFLIENPSIDAIDKFLDDLYEMRAESLKEKGEFGLGNLIFKELRNKDLLNKLKDLRNKLKSNELSL